MNTKPPAKQKPDIWIQKQEGEGRADCGCTLQQTYDDGPKFFFCPLHKAAADLLKACKAARISLIDDDKYAEFQPLLKTLEASIAKAKPPKPSEPGWFA